MLKNNGTQLEEENNILRKALESILSSTTRDIYNEVGSIEVINMCVRPAAKKALSMYNKESK